MDLRDALYVWKKRRERGDKETRIGRVVKEINGFNSFPIDSVIVFQRKDGEKSLKIETPMNIKEILAQTAKGSKLITIKTTLNVPEEYIEEIIFE